MQPTDFTPGAPDPESPAPRAAGADAPTRSPRAGASPGSRARVLSHAGVTWTVTECDGARVPGARGSKCLTFASPEVVRRVWEVPADWRTLPDAELFALSWRR